MPQPRRRDRATTRAGLLAAARTRFARHGYDGAGVRDIAGDIGVDPALVFRYFGSKKALYAEAMRLPVPEGLTRGAQRPVPHIADAMLREVVFGQWPEFGGEHPLVAMLRSSGHPGVRDELRDGICGGYLGDLADRIDGPDAQLRAEMVGALLIGLGVLRDVVEAPAVSQASFEQVRGLVADMVRAATGPRG
ncbi:MAG: TetR/AcrR family transcriptional regulator [Nocardia sp.]|nr:TetR/AcrR family transcriptional regulator [Nocardia sp.]